MRQTPDTGRGNALSFNELFAPYMPDWRRSPLNLCCFSTNAMARLNISALSCGKSTLCD